MVIAAIDTLVKSEISKTPWGIRHLQTLLLFFGMMLAFAMRVNMSLAIVAMTDTDSSNSFDWNMQTQSVILSSFFWGYVVLQIPGGELAARFGGKVLITLCMGINALISLLLPLGAHYGGWQLVCGCRVLQGLSQAFLFPSTHNLIGKWVPLEEKGRLGTIIYAGAQFGTALQLIGGGFTAEYLGWPAIFYINGILSAIWTVFYMYFGSDSPQNSRTISKEERDFIQNSLGHVGEQKKHKTPWLSIMMSLPFLSLVLAHCGQNWGFGTLMTEMPSYMNHILGVNIKSNGVMSALPYLTMYLLSFPMGYLSDLVLRKKWLSITTCRKISNSISQYGAAVAMLVLTFVPTGNVALAVVILIVVVGLNSGQYTGFMLVHIDMAPNFAGTLMGITNCLANIISIVSPLVAGYLLQDETDINDWRKVFYVSSAVYIFSNTCFLLFGSSEVQAWNDVKDDDNDDKKNMEKQV